MKFFIYLLLFVFSCNLQASSISQAKQLFDQEDYNGAIKVFLELENSKMINDSVLFYNLGNCYYKLNELGKARAYYLKSLKIDPRNKDARYNIKVLEDLLNIQQEKENFIENFLSYFSINELLIFNLIIFTLTIILIFFFYIRLKKGKFSYLLIFCSACLFILLFIVLIFCYLKNDIDKNYAGVVVKKTYLYSAPSNNATTLLELNEGCNVAIDVLDNNEWLKIIYNNEYVGWIQKDKIMEL